MKLLDRYILREMVVPFLIGQCAIVLMLTGTVLYNNANVLLQNQVPVVYVVRMVIFFLPFLVHMTMPVAMAVAASLAISRLGRDSEITVLRASGYSLRRIFRPIFLTGLLVSIADFYFGEYIVPPSVQRFDDVVAEMITHVPRLSPVSGQYIVSTDQSYVLYVKSMIPKPGYIDLYGVQIVASPKIIYGGDSAIPVVVDAEHGRFENGKWTLERPTIWGHRPGAKEALELTPTKKTVFELYTAVDP
jgi:lipopolysaccharide export system permease protein